MHLGDFNIFIVFPLLTPEFPGGLFIARVYYCFQFFIRSYGSLQQIAIKIFSLVYFHFGKKQSNTFNKRISKILDGLKNGLGQ